MQGVAFAGALCGCFRDQSTAIDRICPAGEDTCRCLEGQECRVGLTCMEDGRCRDPRCVDGRMGCMCIDGDRCDDGLQCVDMSCLVPGADDSTSDSGVAESTPLTTEPATTTSMPGTTSQITTGPDVTSESVSVSDTLPGTEVEVSGVMTTNISVADTGVVSDTEMMSACQCGWSESQTYYACGLDVLPYDPDPVDAYPFECPNGAADAYAAWAMGEVVSCDQLPGVDTIGCCIPGVNIWCSGASLVFEDCNENHSACQI